MAFANRNASSEELAGAECEEGGGVTLALNAMPDSEVHVNVRQKHRDTGYASSEVLSTPADFERRSMSFVKDDLRQTGRGGGLKPVTDGHSLPVLEGLTPGHLSRFADANSRLSSDGPRPVLHGSTPCSSPRRSLPVLPTTGGLVSVDGFPWRTSDYVTFRRQDALRDELRVKDRRLQEMEAELQELRRALRAAPTPTKVAESMKPVLTSEPTG